jgi:hypothetical protein
VYYYRMITDRDLLQKENKNKYSMAEIMENINHLNVKFLLHTQILTEEFCVEYILDMRMNSGDEDSYLLCEDYILGHQPHLDEKLFLLLRDIKYKDWVEE